MIWTISVLLILEFFVLMWVLDEAKIKTICGRLALWLRASGYRADRRERRYLYITMRQSGVLNEGEVRG